MIQAKKSATFERAFALYLIPLIKKSFSRVLLQNPQPVPGQPVLFIANHSSWWDGLIFFFLNKTIWHHDIHMMMHEEGLKKYPYFRFLGAFSLNRKNPKDILESLQYAEQLLKQGKTVVLFPQGDEFHQEIRPLKFQSGVVYLLERCQDVPIVPLSFYYSFGHEQKPDLWIRQGAVLKYSGLEGSSRKEKTAFLQTSLTAQLDALKQVTIEENAEGFQDLKKRGKRS